MKNDGLTFLYGVALSTKIREICLAPDVRCAVAFWGVGMADTLFKPATKQNLKIICDISMGATCKRALQELGAPENTNLRVHQGLHGKVYLCEFGAVIGSPNASDNGIGRVDGESGRLLETGLFCPAGSKPYAEASTWFDSLYQESRQVNDEDLRNAPEHSGEMVPRGSRRTLERLSLLERLRKYPQNFRDVHIVIAGGYLDAEQESETQNEIARNLELRNYDYDVICQDFDNIFEPFYGLPLIFLYREPRHVYVAVTVYLSCRTWPQENPNTVLSINDKGQDWEVFWARIGQTPCLPRLNKKESRIIKKMIEEKGKWLFSAAEFSDKLTQLLRQDPHSLTEAADE